MSLNDAAPRICIYGAGAIGGFLGVRLGLAGARMSAVARGATLQALRTEGLQLRQAGQLHRVDIEAHEEAATLGVQDLVVISVKEPAMRAVAAGIGPLLGPDTVVLVAMNGVPWWFFQGMAGPCAGMRLETVDPGQAISKAIPAQHVLGCVVHASCAVERPGLIRHNVGAGLIVGEPAGGRSERLQAVLDWLLKAGFDATASECIQRDIWYKLWGNMTMNPVSAITGATADRILDDDFVRDFNSRAMSEAAEIGARIGCAIDQTPEERHAVTRKLGAFRTSMLQDAEAGRPLEIDALVTVVREIGQRVGVPTPNIEALLGLVRLFARSRGLYPA